MPDLSVSLLAEVVVGLLIVYPAWRIFQRAGFSGWWALLVLVPGFGLLAALGLLAVAGWPALPGGRTR